MRKRTIKTLSDTIFWYGLYFLPILAFLVILYRTGVSAPLSEVITSLGLGVPENSIIYQTLSSVFGSAGVLPLFNSPDLLVFFSYFVNVYIAHLMVDFVLFIPRLAHKWLNYFTRGDE